METREELGEGAHGADPGVDPSDVDRIGALVTERLGVAPRRIERIPAGLGDRRFYRIALAAQDPRVPPSDDSTSELRTLIARVEPKRSATGSAPSPTPPFSWLPEPLLEPIRSVLEAAGLPVPRSYGHDPDAGIDLLEDLGTKTLADVPNDDLREPYFQAAALIPRIQAVVGNVESAPAFGRPFDEKLVGTKAAKVIHWSWPGLLGREANAHERQEIQSGFSAIAPLLVECPRRLAHRDFKAENLHRAQRNANNEPWVMIDVQGAFMAPPEYDLVCLLRDLQVEIPEALVEEIRGSLLSELAGRTRREDAERRFEAISVVRLSKDLAHIVHAAKTRGDARRWHEIPRGLQLLDEALGRLEHTFPPARPLAFVMHALTRDAQYSDIPDSRQGP
jgi:aminoglycoside/choline kinase family phosphotransferase